jgi:hypothetical protein
MTGLDWQDIDPDAYDPEHPLHLLEKAGAKEETERAMAAVRAVRSMIAAGADAGVMAVARDFVKRTKVLAIASFDNLVHEARGGDGDTGEPERKSVATALVDLAQEFYTFGVSDLGEPFAIPIGGPRVVAMLRGSKTSLRALLARAYFSRTGKAATQQALADALLVIEGMAQEQGESRLYMRAAQHDSALWLDLGDSTGRAVRITSAGWAVEDQAPVLFKRTSLTGPLPEPQRGGDLSRLWDWLNVSEDDRPLVAAELVARLFSEIPHVVLAIFGEHGTGKTTATKVLVLLLDPGPVPVRKPPRDAESWVTAASGSWVVGLDNLSDIPPWLSDALCRASTGDGDVRRKLYTDGDFAVFAFRRCVIFDSIDVGALAPDLADRTVPITLDLIPEEHRTDEETFWGSWAEAHPKLLGAVLDLAAAVLRQLPSVELARKPRMADFARILAAVDAELGTKALARYARQATDMAAESLSGDSFAARIQMAMTETFTGTSAALLKLIRPADPADGEWTPPKDWPKDARAATGKIRRLAPAFRKIGWGVEDLGSENHDKLLHWKISPPAQPEKSGDDTRPSPQDPQDAGAAGVGGGESGTSASAGREKNCSRCGDRPAGPGGVLCPYCKESLSGRNGPPSPPPPEKDRGDTRQPPQDPHLCPGCGDTEDSIFHATLCTGPGPALRATASQTGEHL